MKRTIGLLALVVMTMIAMPALAQQAEEEAEMVERTIDFSDEVVEGELVRPEGDLIEGQRGREAASLIRVREHFIDKMIQSAEDL